ncbi:MAG: hypothetical protein M0Z54_04470 [Thermaerobacter sp.]|nr:hypothetical protein [Thermaerobacter sp.]
MRTQRILGLVAFGLAAVVLAAAVLLVGRASRPALGAPFTPPSLRPLTGPPHTVHQVAPLAPGNVVAVSAAVGDVSVTTTRTAHDVRLTARLYHGERVVMQQHGGTLSIRLVGVGGSPSGPTSLCLIFCSSSTSLSGLGSGSEANIHVWLTVPADGAISAQLGVGTLLVSGQYQRVLAVTQAGSVTATHVAAPTLNLATQVGGITVTGATGVQHLTLSAQAGLITYEGTLGTSTRMTDQAGAVRLRVDPTARIAASVTVTAGAFTSGFAHLSGGTFGTFRGVMGTGTREGQLTVTDEAGAVSIQPWTPRGSGAG